MAKRHWTSESAKDYFFAVAFDFVSEIENSMSKKGINQKELAGVLGIGESRVSQVVNNPSNLTLRTMVEWTTALKMKLALVAYDDGDEDNFRGPIYSGVFRECWEILGKPVDRWALDAARQKKTGYRIFSSTCAEDVVLEDEALRWLPAANDNSKLPCAA